MNELTVREVLQRILKQQKEEEKTDTVFLAKQRKTRNTVAELRERQLDQFSSKELAEAMPFKGVVQKASVNNAEFGRRVPSKIAIHTILRHTYSGAIKPTIEMDFEKNRESSCHGQANEITNPESENGAGAMPNVSTFELPNNKLEYSFKPEEKAKFPDSVDYQFPSYEEENLSKTNPTLALNLARVLNFPDPMLKTFPITENITLGELLTRKSQFEREQAKRAKQANLSITNSIDLEKDNADLSYNGNSVRVVPSSIGCQLCGSSMRLVTRRCFYRGTLRQYRSYRCSRRGCQTFRSVKNSMNLEFARTLEQLQQNSETVKVSKPFDMKCQNTLGNDDLIEGLLMKMPEEKKKQLELEKVKEETDEKMDYDEPSNSNQPDDYIKKENDLHELNRLHELRNLSVFDRYKAMFKDDEPIVKDEPLDDYEDMVDAGSSL